MSRFSLSENLLHRILQPITPMLHPDKSIASHCLLTDLERKNPIVLRSLGIKVWLLRSILWCWKNFSITLVTSLFLVSLRHWNKCKHLTLLLSSLLDMLKLEDHLVKKVVKLPERKCFKANDVAPVIPAYIIQVL